MIWAIIIIFAVVLDQVTKYLVVQNITLGGSITIIDRFFYLTHVRNTGAAWSIFQNGRYFFIVLTIIVSAGMIYFLYKSYSRFLSVSLSLVLGGAVGNLIDRIYRGNVVDFFEFHFGNYIFPIFNVADIFVVVGTGFLAYYMLFIYKDGKADEIKD